MDFISRSGSSDILRSVIKLLDVPEILAFAAACRANLDLVHSSPEAQLILLARLYDRTEINARAILDDVPPALKLQRFQELETNIARMRPIGVRIIETSDRQYRQQRFGRYALTEADYGPTIIDLSEWPPNEANTKRSQQQAGCPVGTFSLQDLGPDASKIRTNASSVWQTVHCSTSAHFLESSFSCDYHINPDMEICLGIWRSFEESCPDMCMMNIYCKKVDSCGVPGLRHCIEDHPLAVSPLLQFPALGTAGPLVFGPGHLAAIWFEMDIGGGYGDGLICVFDWVKGLLLTILSCGGHESRWLEDPFTFINDSTIAVWPSQDSYAELQQPIRLYEFDHDVWLLDLKIENQQAFFPLSRMQRAVQEIHFPRLDRTKISNIGHGIVRPYLWPEGCFLGSTGGNLLLGCVLSFCDWNQETLQCEGYVAEGTMKIPTKKAFEADPSPFVHGVTHLNTASSTTCIQIERTFPYISSDEAHYSPFGDFSATFGGRIFRLGLDRSKDSTGQWVIMTKDCSQARQRWYDHEGSRRLGALRALRFDKSPSANCKISEQLRPAFRPITREWSVIGRIGTGAFAVPQWWTIEDLEMNIAPAEIPVDLTFDGERLVISKDSQIVIFDF